MYCRNCGEEIDSDSRYCPYCGFTTGAADRVPDFGPEETVREVEYKEKSEFVAILLSFFIIGLGNIYAGKAADGIKLFILAILLSFLIGLLVMIEPVLGAAGILAFVLWLYGMYDAYMVCKEYNRGLRETGYPPW